MPYLRNVKINNNKMELTQKSKDELINGNVTVHFGEHLIVKQATNTTFIVKNGAKLTCKKSEKCRFFHELKGEVELKNDSGSVQQDV